VRILASLILGSFLFTSLAFAQGPSGKGFVEITEEDGSPSCFGYQIKYTNGDVTDNSDGTCSVDTAGASTSQWTDTGTVLHPTDSSGTLDNVVVH